MPNTKKPYIYWFCFYLYESKEWADKVKQLRCVRSGKDIHVYALFIDDGREYERDTVVTYDGYKNIDRMARLASHDSMFICSAPRQSGKSYMEKLLQESESLWLSCEGEEKMGCEVRMQLFVCVAVYQKAQVVKEMCCIPAENSKQAEMLMISKLPDEYKAGDKLKDVEVVVRPF